MFLKQLFADEAKLWEQRYAGFKDIKFPRAKTLVDLYCLILVSFGWNILLYLVF